MVEELLVEEMVKNLKDGTELNKNSVKFALRVSRHLNKQDRNQFYRAFWFTNDLSFADIKGFISQITGILERNRKVMTFDEVYGLIKDAESRQTIQSILRIDWNFMMLDNGAYGLKSWRFLNPRSIKDCIMIILNERQKPMHFREILKELSIRFPKRRKVTLQACHNELIRHDEFVLLGRGSYGLRKWGMAAGTVL